MTKCQVCEDVMFADEEWRLRDGLAVGEPAQGDDYVHERCYGDDK